MDSGKERVILKGKDNYEVWKFQYDIFNTGMKEKDKKKFIVSTVCENVLRKLTSCKTSDDMLVKLLSLYGVNLTLNKLHLQNKFYSLKCGKNVMDFIEEIDNISGKLEEVGENLSDEMKTAKVLNSLPAEYESFVTAFECAGSTSFENLRMRLMFENERRSTRKLKTDEEETKEENDKILFSKFVKLCNYCKKPGHLIKDCEGIKRNNATKTCYACNQIGHIARYCRNTENTNTSRNPIKSNNTEENVNLAATVLNVSYGEEFNFKNEWILDTGATQHMALNREWFEDFTPVSGKQVTMPNGNCLDVLGIGNIILKSCNTNLTLKNTLYIPELKFNLIAAKQFTSQGIKIIFDDEKAMFLMKDKVVLHATFQNGLYILDCEKKLSFLGLTLSDWHERLGHQNLTYVKDILLRNGIKFTENSFECEKCKIGKMTRKSFMESSSRAEEVGDLVHMDVGGPMEEKSLGGNRYYLLLRDDYSNWRMVYFMKQKSEVRQNIQFYLKYFKNQTGKNIKRFRSDNGLEEVNKGVADMFDEYGIIHEKTCPYTPEQNGRIERDNRTVVECARTMLLGAKLSKQFWAEATNAAVYILNRTGRTSVCGKAPIELFCRRSFDLNFLKPYGSEVYVHTPKVKRTKWDAKARKGTFVGYDDETKGYRIYLHDKKAVETHIDVDFLKSDSIALCQTTVQCEEPPTSYEEIHGRPDADEWNEAIRDELEAMKINEVWEEVVAPNKQMIDSKWVFKIKKEGQYKARLVARGCLQQNFNEIEAYAPVAKLETVRLFLALAAKFELKVHHMDVNTAFLNGLLNEDIFMKPPPGLEVKPANVLKLKKAIYGLKQAPKCWNERLNKELKILGFVKSEYDECVYFKANLFLIVYVDDLLIVSRSMTEIEELKNQLLNIFSMKDLGEVETFLGLAVARQQGVLTIDQETLIEKAVKKFGVVDSTNVKTPMEKDLNLVSEERDKTKKPYRELLGTIMYIMSGCRPDVSYAVNYLSRFQDCASDRHYSYLIRVLKYLKTTKDLKLIYNGDSDEALKCEVDASWGDVEDRKSTTGYVIRVFGNPVLWKTRKQTTVALSSAEAEYIALYEAVRDVVWFKGLIEEIKINVEKVKVYEDNTSCISIATSNGNSRRTKHFDVKCHYVREKVEDGTIELIHVDSEEQTADIFTKSLAYTKFCNLRGKLNMTYSSIEGEC